MARPAYCGLCYDSALDVVWLDHPLGSAALELAHARGRLALEDSSRGLCDFCAASVGYPL